MLKLEGISEVIQPLLISQLSLGELRSLREINRLVW